MFTESFNKTASTRLGKMIARKFFKSTPKKISVNERDFEKKVKYLKEVAKEKGKIPKSVKDALGLDDRLRTFKATKAIKNILKNKVENY